MTTYAIVTGASAGLGREFAKLFAAAGHGVVLVARRKNELDVFARQLEGAYSIPTLVVAADLADRAAPKKIFDAVTDAGIDVEFLVNNAGYGSNGTFAELDIDKEIGMVEVNVTSLLALTRLFLPAMIKAGRGRVLNIGSTAGFQPGPFMSTYYASKAFVNSFTEALAFELRGTGVTATVSCPGPTATEFAAIAGNDKTRLFTEKSGVATAADVAREAYEAMKAGKSMVVHGFKNKLGAQALRFSPRAAVIAIAAKLNRTDAR